MTAEVWFRHRLNSGDLGKLIHRNGADFIELDRPGENLRPYRPSEWIPEKPPSILYPGAPARVAFEADKALCAALNMHLVARKEWLSMSEAARIAWTKNGPKNAEPPNVEIRVKMYETILALLEPLTR